MRSARPRRSRSVEQSSLATTRRAVVLCRWWQRLQTNNPRIAAAVEAARDCAVPLTKGPGKRTLRADPAEEGRDTDTHALRQAEVQRRLRGRRRFWFVYRRFESSLLSQPHGRSETAKPGSGICAYVPWLAKRTCLWRRRKSHPATTAIARRLCSLDSGGSSSPTVRDGARLMPQPPLHPRQTRKPADRATRPSFPPT